ncbi:MAG: site-specific integrase [Clostridiales bacterium]|nr:site-specific integrase [Eubacteriales bacterium]MDH7567359.1 site-specific integrase [Clostridiales bacterium]
MDAKALHLALEQKYVQNQESTSMSSILRIFSILTVINHYLMSDERDEGMKSPRPCQNPFARYRFHNAREYKTRTPAIPESVMEQVDAHIDELDPIYKLIYLIFSSTGMRTKEVLFLEADCLEASRYENLLQLKYKPYKVLSARRRAGVGDYHRVLITAALADEIKKQIEKTAKWRSTYNLPYIFINKRSNFKANMINMNNFRNHINALIRKHNICDDNAGLWHFTCMQHRKTLTVILIENGATVDELAYWLGHLTRTTASNYYAEVRKMRLAELNTEYFRKMFDLLLSEEQLSKYSEEERRLLYIDFRLEQRKVEFGYCLQKLADGGCSNRNSLYNCINCKNLCTGKKYLPYWQELLSQQQLAVKKLLEIYAKNNITEADFVDFKEYKQEIFLLQCYENMVKAIECGVM